MNGLLFSDLGFTDEDVGVDESYDGRGIDTGDSDMGNYPDPSGETVSEVPPSDDPQCVECGREFEWAHRGRKPKRCPDCRATPTRTRGAKESGGSSSKSDDPELDARIKRIRGDMLEGIGGFSGTAVLALPVTSQTLLLRGPMMVDSLLTIARHYPRMLDGVEKASQIMPAIGILSGSASLAYAASVDFGITNPHSGTGKMLGVSEAASRIGWQPKARTKPQRLEGDFVIPESQMRYQPVG